jgi:hypothetical protein
MAETVAADHHQKALAALVDADVAGEAGEALGELATSLLNRVN